MEETKVIYQIKNLDKIILRNFFLECELNKKIKQFKLTPTQIQIIEYILKSKDKEISQKKLEDILKLRRATVSGVLHTMEKNNLIERCVSTDDAREKVVKLTKKAEKIFLESKLKFDKIEKKITNGISNEELSIFFNITNKMRENIENYDKL